MLLEIVFVVLLGFIIGSFLNVCIYRIPRQESILNPPSHCPNCMYKLEFFDLIPVFSFLLLKGKCRKCKIKISLEYPLIEVFTAIIFLAIYYKYYISYEFFTYSIFMSILIVVFFIDIKHLIIPNSLVLAGIAVGVVTITYNIFYPMNIYGDRDWWNPLLGMLIGSGFLLLVSLLGMLFYKCNEVMGMGDVKLFFPIGMILGWRITIIALILSIFLGAIVSAILMILGLKNRKSNIAFGPFIAISTFVAILWGWRVLWWFVGVC